MYCYGSATSGDYGNILLRTGINNNVGNGFSGAPEFAALTGWANLDGTSATSPLLSSNAGDSPFTGTTELLPVEIWSGINTDINLSGGANPPFSFNQRFLGTSQLLRVGRANFGNFTLSTEEVTSRTITAATNASPIQITTSVGTSLATGQTVTISGVAGNTAANGTFKITVVNSTTFTLDGSTGNGTYTSGGTVNGCPKWLHLQNGIYLMWNGCSGITA